MRNDSNVVKWSVVKWGCPYPWPGWCLICCCSRCCCCCWLHCCRLRTCIRWNSLWRCIALWATYCTSIKPVYLSIRPYDRDRVAWPDPLSQYTHTHTHNNTHFVCVAIQDTVEVKVPLLALPLSITNISTVLLIEWSQSPLCYVLPALFFTHHIMSRPALFFTHHVTSHHVTSCSILHPSHHMMSCHVTALWLLYCISVKFII